MWDKDLRAWSVPSFACKTVSYGEKAWIGSGSIALWADKRVIKAVDLRIDKELKLKGLTNFLP